MPEFNLNYENISVDYNANKEDTAGGNTLGGGDIILVDIHGGEGGSFAEIDESNLAGGGKTIAGWGVGGIEADDDDGDHDIIFDPDGDLLPPNKPTGGGGDDAGLVLAAAGRMSPPGMLLGMGSCSSRMSR